MDLAHGNKRANNGFRVKELNSIGSGTLNTNPLLIIKLPDSRVLRIMSRSFFLAIVLLALPSIGPFMSGSSNAIYESDMDFDLATSQLLPVIFPDLVNEGLVRRGQMGLILGGSGMGEMRKDLEFLSENGIHLDMVSNLAVIPNEAFDFVFGWNCKSISSADGVLRANGIVITQMKNEPLTLLQQFPNYRIVYLRRFQNTIVAMRKGRLEKDGLESSTEKLKLCGMRKEARKVALRGLEDALLEPPRGPRLKSMNGIGKFKFLPDLVGDSLEAYMRRIFISDEKNGGIEEWFYKNYPTRNQYFEMYKLDAEVYDSKISPRIMVTSSIGVSDWMRSNIGKEDFVVMKAEEQLVEEMMKDKTICLVDELFLECKSQWQDEGKEHESKRAYWQCLALYGNLRDQGVAVHQWWS